MTESDRARSGPEDASRSVDTDAPTCETPSGIDPFTVATWSVAGIGVLSLVTLLTRLFSTIAVGRWSVTSGLESVGLTVIERTALDWRPYHDLGQNATTALFNTGFYAAYGFAARLIGPDPAQRLLGLRLLTLFGCVVAAVVTAGALRSWIVPSGTTRARAWLGSLAVTSALLFGPFVSWWPLTVRPDAWVLALEACGLVAAVAALRDRRAGHAALSAVCFAFAFTLKQNAVFAAAGTALAFMLAGRLSWAGWIAGGMALAGLACAGVSGPYYFDHVVRAAASSAVYSLASFRTVLLTAIPSGFFVFVPAVALIGLFLRRRSPALPLALTFLLALAGGLVQISRDGSSRNYLFTAYLAAGLMIVLGSALLRVSQDWRRWLVAGSMVAGCLLSALYLVVPNQFGRLTLDVDVPAMRARIDGVKQAEHPVFVEDPFVAMPMNSGDPQAESLDPCVYPFAVANGTIPVSVEQRMARRVYASAFVRDPTFARALDEAGYVPVREWPDGTRQFRRP